MSILSDLLSDLGALFFPSCCPVCGERLKEGNHVVCTRCRADIPLTNFCHEVDNPLVRRLWGLLPVVQASAFIYFTQASGWRRLIHRFKYKGAWRLARQMGEWYGQELKESGLYDDVDVVVPVPLHLFKLLRRGYNQSDYLAEGIAVSLGVKVDRRSVVRRRNNPSQTQSEKSERWKNVERIFAVKRPKNLEGHHILLVDDVFTTGSTMISCGSEILRAVPNCHLSVASLAASQREFGYDH
ncbi:MAG: phosphoribosyltransferase family protein [Alistipes sp.]